MVVIVGFVSCTESRNHKKAQSLQDLEELVPKQLTTFDHIDSLYYSYLGISSIGTKSGDFIVSIFDPAMLARINAEATQVSYTTHNGRGPGEVLDVGLPTSGEDLIYVYDQSQSKILVLKKEDLSLVQEMVPEPYQEFSISRVYPAFSNGMLPLVLGQSQLIIDKMGEKRLILFDPRSNKYGQSIPLQGVAYAPLGNLINGRSGSAIRVPYTDNQLIAPVPENKTLLLYDTRTDVIAEIDANFDTLRTISVNLPTEKITENEKDRFKKEQDLSQQDWKNVEPYFPEVKAKAADMIYFNNTIWLKSNMEAEGADVWLILNMDGEIEYKVHLPGNSFLTHVASHNLGVRLDDTHFALYQNPLTN
jgi:hypothetical protein